MDLVIFFLFGIVVPFGLEVISVRDRIFAIAGILMSFLVGVGGALDTTIVLRSTLDPTTHLYVDNTMPFYPIPFALILIIAVLGFIILYTETEKYKPSESYPE